LYTSCALGLRPSAFFNGITLFIKKEDYFRFSHATKFVPT